MADANDPNSATSPEGESRAKAAAPAGNRNIQIVAGLVFAALVAVVLIVVVSGGSGKKPAAKIQPGQIASGGDTTAALLSGIEQHGFTLGDPKAKVNLIEFLDVQCPYCQAHQLDQQPTVIKDAVRTGKATLTMQPLAVLGDDSQRGRIVVTKMAAIDHAWDFLNLWYLNQRTENTGYVTPTFLKGLALATPTQPVALTATSPTPAVTAKLAEIDAAAKALKVKSVPTFAIGKTGEPYSKYKVVDAYATSEAPALELVGYVNAALGQ